MMLAFTSSCTHSCLPRDFYGINSNIKQILIQGRDLSNKDRDKIISGSSLRIAKGIAMETRAVGGPHTFNAPFVGWLSSMDDWAYWSDPCIRLIVASVAAATTNNRQSSMDNSSICGQYPN